MLTQIAQFVAICEEGEPAEEAKDGQWNIMYVYTITM